MHKYKYCIKAKTGLFDLRLKELFSSRYLVSIFVKRDFIANYKQTLLGPLWYIISPLITTLMFTVVFGNIARLSTDGAPQFLFYMSANILWSYFSVCTTKISNTFVSNARLFGKVYFNRLTVPVSVCISAMINFLIQFLLYLGFVIYYACTGAVEPNIYVLLTPVLLFETAILALGVGITVSSLTTKYRDLSVLVGFAMTLWMYISPVVYPASTVPEKWLWLYMLNPVCPIIETFRYAFLGTGSVSFTYLAISFLVSGLLLFIGLILFCRVEKTFMDTV